MFFFLHSTAWKKNHAQKAGPEEKLLAKCFLTQTSTSARMRKAVKKVRLVNLKALIKAKC